MVSDELNDLGTYWLEKLPNVCYEQTLESCKRHKAYGTQPEHAHFYYPKETGYGEVWSRMAETLKKHILYNTDVKLIDFEETSVASTDGKIFKQILSLILFGKNLMFCLECQNICLITYQS